MNYVVFMKNTDMGWSGWLRIKSEIEVVVTSKRSRASEFETEAQARETARLIVARIRATGGGETKFTIPGAASKKNPTKKAPKSRSARMKRLSAIVAKAAAGSAYNKAKRRPRKLQYIARGTSKAAANSFAKAAKRLKLNPVSRAENEAAELLENFSGHAASRETKVRVPRMHTALAVGKLAGVLYEATRDGETDLYCHEFKNRSRPLLVASHDGKQLGIVGGRYQFTERGIVDK